MNNNLYVGNKRVFEYIRIKLIYFILLYNNTNVYLNYLAR